MRKLLVTTTVWLALAGAAPVAHASPDPNWSAFEHFDGSYSERTSVPGGWLVRVWNGVGYALAYVSDPQHAWQPQPAPYALNAPTRVGQLVQFTVVDQASCPSNPACTHKVWINLDQVVAVTSSAPTSSNPNGFLISTTKGDIAVSDFDPAKLMRSPPTQ